MNVRAELDSLHAALFHMQQEFGKLRLEQGISREEAYKRLVWYSHLEQLAVTVNEFLSGKASEADLREMADQVAKVHRFVSPAARPPGVEEAAAEQAGVVPFRRPA